MRPGGRRDSSPAGRGIAHGLRKGARLLVALLLVACMVPLAPASASEMAAGGAPGLQAADSDRVSELLAAMTLDDKVSQMIVPSLRTWDGTAATSLADARGLAEALQKHRYGGVILYGQNITGSAQIARFTTQLQANNAGIAGAGAHIPYLMCVDGEGGVVSRLATGSRMTGSMAIGATGSNARDNALATGKVIGEELAAAGFNVDFAPDIDVNSNPANPVIGTRSFSDDPQVVGELGAAFAEGLSASKVIATYKHFPGHGDTGTDTHLDVSAVTKTLDELKACELVPFAHNLEGADLVMTAHVTLPRIDDGATFADGTKGYYPATMSPKALTGILRDGMGYDGVVITDALEMDALYKVPLVEGGGGTEAERRNSAVYGANLAAKVIEAGGDILLAPRDLISADVVEYFDEYIAALVAKAQADPAFAARIDESAGRILKMKEKYGILDMDTSGCDVDQKAANAEQVIGSAAHRAVESSIARQAVTLLKNEGDALPLSGHSGNVVVFARDSDHVATVEYAIRKMQAAGLVDADARIVNLEDGTATGSDTASTRITIGFYRDYPASGATVHYTDEMKAAVENADAVVAFSINFNLAALQPAADQYQGVSQIMADAHAAGAPFVLLSSNLPYDAARYQDADAIMCCYMSSGLDSDPTDAAGNLSAYNANVVAALESMFGAFAPTGTLPVSIPAIELAPDGAAGYSTGEALYSRGFGLDARAQVSGATVDGIADKSYTGHEITQDLTVALGGRKLTEGVDYTLAYEGNLDAGTATVRIEGAGWYTGTAVREFAIKPQSVKPAISLSKTSYTWNGKAKTPRVAVKAGSRALAEGVDYTLAYAKGRKNVGRYAVTVKCKGNYEFAAQTLAFKINPKGTKLKAVAAGPRKVTVKWAKQLAKMSSSKVTGYRIQLSTSPTFKKGNKLITVKGAAKTSKAIGKLKAKKRYYARVQTYKKAGGKTYYSAWSAKKGVRTKG